MSVRTLPDDDDFTWDEWLPALLALVATWASWGFIYWYITHSVWYLVWVLYPMLSILVSMAFTGVTEFFTRSPLLQPRYDWAIVCMWSVVGLALAALAGLVYLSLCLIAPTSQKQPNFK